MELSQKQYSELYKNATRGTKSYKTIPMAFLVGGAICTLGEWLLNMFDSFFEDAEKAGICTSIVLVFLSALFTGLGLYQKLAKHAGAGTLVPITGFANSVVAPAIEFKTEGYILGVGAKIFIISGPVILYGTVASMVYGVVYYLFTNVF